jgi:hypothetical protein
VRDVSLKAMRSALVAAFVAACGFGCGDGSGQSGSGATARADKPADRSLEIAIVAWPSSATLSLATRAELTSDARQAVARSALPVLVPADSSLARSARVMVEDQFFAVSSRADSIHVSLHATRVSHRYPGIAPIRGDRLLRGAAGFVTRNEGIWSATWKESGISYVLDLECASPTDARCASDQYLLELVERLAYVGGLAEARP